MKFSPDLVYEDQLSSINLSGISIDYKEQGSKHDEDSIISELVCYMNNYIQSNISDFDNAA